MFRFLLVICILWIANGVSAQEHVVKKSSDIVVIKGKSYYLHTVESGQTLYSISKAYGVDVNEIREINGKKDNTLSLYEVIKVPYSDPFVQKDSKYYYHKVKKGETLYSLSRDYNIKPRRILKVNEKYNESLPLGAVVRLPLDEITIPATGKVKEENSIVRKEEKVVLKEVPVVAADVKTKPDAKSELKETVKKKDTESVLPVVVLKKEEEEKDMPSYISNVVMLDDSPVKVALLLPFYASEYPSVSDTLNYGTSTSLSARSEQFVYFYEGILLALDSLKNKGYKIDLHVYDTEKNTERMNALTKELDRLSPDLIIGPVYASVFRTVIDNLQNKNVPIVYPLSSRTENFGEYPNFIQVNTSFGTLAGKMTDWLSAQRANANIINIDLANTGNDEDRNLFAQKMKQIGGVHFFKWNSGDPLNALKPLLLPDRENIIVLPTIKEADVSRVLPALSVYAENYKITVIGFPEWQTFTSVEHETYFKLNTKIFTYSYVDSHAPAALDFALKYRKYFYAEPNSIVFKAYDLGLYFIELAAKYRNRTLEAIDYYHKEGVASRFNFSKIHNGEGKENQALFIVNFSSDYQLKIQGLE